MLRLKGTQRSPNPGGSKIGMIKEEALKPGELHPCRHRDTQGKAKGVRISTSPAPQAPNSPRCTLRNSSAQNLLEFTTRTLISGDAQHCSCWRRFKSTWAHNEIHVKEEKIQHRGKCRSCSETSSPCQDLGQPCLSSNPAQGQGKTHQPAHFTVGITAAAAAAQKEPKSSFQSNLRLQNWADSRHAARVFTGIPQQEPSKFPVWWEGGWDWMDYSMIMEREGAPGFLSHHYSSFSKLIKPALHFLQGLHTPDWLWPANVEFELLHPAEHCPGRAEWLLPAKNSPGASLIKGLFLLPQTT